MKFSASQGSLTQAVAVVAKGMATNSTLPVLSGIYLRATDGVIEFQTSNLTISIRHRIAALVEEPGETVVSGKLLSNIIKNLPDTAVSFETEGRSLTIKADKSVFRLNTLPASDFPEFPSFSPDRTVELPSTLLKDMVDKVYKVTSKDASRPILSGILLTVENNTIRLVATDSYRLAVCDSNVETSTLKEPFAAIVQGTTFHDVLTLPSMTERLSVGTSESQVVFSFGDTTYICRRIEGNFPNYQQLLPKSSVTSVKMSVENLSAALRRVSVIALTNSSVRFDVDVDGQVLRLSSSSPDQGDSSEMLGVEATGQSLSIALNYHYVFDCVNAASGQDELTLELQSSMQPGVFKSYAKINYLYLLMPVRM